MSESEVNQLHLDEDFNIWPMTLLIHPKIRFWHTLGTRRRQDLEQTGQRVSAAAAHGRAVFRVSFYNMAAGDFVRCERILDVITSDD